MYDLKEKLRNNLGVNYFKTERDFKSNLCGAPTSYEYILWRFYLDYRLVTIPRDANRILSLSVTQNFLKNYFTAR